MSFVSSLERVAAWRSTRFAWPRFLPLAGLLVWAAFAAGGASAATTAAGFLLAVSLVAQFRLWDDLVDRARDRDADPPRVLAQCASTVAFERIVALLGAANAFVLLSLHGEQALLGYLLLNATAALWYLGHRARGLAHALILHLKYPVFILLIAPPAVVPLAGAAIVYAAVVGFELLDEPRLHARAGRIVLAASLLFLALVAFVAGSGFAAASVATALALVVVAIGVRLRWATAGLRYLPFALAAIDLALVTYGGAH